MVNDDTQSDWLHPTLRAVEGHDLVISYVRADGSKFEDRVVFDVRFYLTNAGDRIMKGRTEPGGPRHTYRLDRITRIGLLNNQHQEAA